MNLIANMPRRSDRSAPDIHTLGNRERRSTGHLFLKKKCHFEGQVSEGKKLLSNLKSI